MLSLSPFPSLSLSFFLSLSLCLSLSFSLMYCHTPLTVSLSDTDQGMERPEACRGAPPPIYGANRELLSPRLGALGAGMRMGADGDLVAPLLFAPVHIDPSCLHPQLLQEVQHVVIAREKLLLHLHQVIGRGEPNNTHTHTHIYTNSTHTLAARVWETPACHTR